MSKNIKAILSNYDQVEDVILKMLSDIGVSSEAPKVELPEGIKNMVTMKGKDPFVKDLTDASDQQIGMLMSYFTNWTIYIHSQEEKAGRLKKIRKQKLGRLVTALKMFLKTEKGVKAGDLKMEVESYCIDEDDLPIFDKANASLLEAELLHSAIEQRHKDLRTVLNAISREQSRRAAEWQSNTRNSSIQNSRPGSGRWNS